MTDFPLAPNGYRFRGLALADPLLRGWDVYALQCGLFQLGATQLVADGVLGPKTHRAIHEYQQAHPETLVLDDIAGLLTQRRIASELLALANADHEVPGRLVFGQLEHESILLLGNQSPIRADGSADCGVAQLNDAFTDHLSAFNPDAAIRKLVAHLRSKHDQYQALGVISDGKTLWKLAAGSWNAPAWADALAAGRTISQSQLDALNGYITHISIYYDRS